jgi:bifunctional UDP-N-acetylglucosamine pyrophosphorylase/glucosamine-1-phosphate N-acetyltransferase
MTSNYNLHVLIAAAGSGTRSGLEYPKTLFQIKGESILSRLLDLVAPYDSKPTIIASPSGEPLIRSHLNELNKDFYTVIQDFPRGMGDAVLSMMDSPSYNKSSNILLLWGDIPFIQKSTLEKTIINHFKHGNDFTFPTLNTDHAYTVLERDENNKVKRLLETREIINHTLSSGERDIGLFIFNKELIFKLLKEDLMYKYSSRNNEHGFLYIIEHLVTMGYRVEALNIAKKLDAISLNKIEDLSEYL